MRVRGNVPPVDHLILKERFIDGTAVAFARQAGHLVVAVAELRGFLLGFHLVGPHFLHDGFEYLNHPLHWERSKCRNRLGHVRSRKLRRQQQHGVHGCVIEEDGACDAEKEGPEQQVRRPGVLFGGRCRCSLGSRTRVCRRRVLHLPLWPMPVVVRAGRGARAVAVAVADTRRLPVVANGPRRRSSFSIHGPRPSSLQHRIDAAG
mmetsp:Transcript_16541/g.46244  ORF Transcript_16541/g.46244 Transcript_16541/m.46244 type:complete len:205 (+) Transcript_16541:1553-2167(+)